MSCNGCGGGFGLFKKEVGCGTCGFSFCSKCCSNRSVTKDGTTYKQLICNKCQAELEGDSVPALSYSPPLAHKKRTLALGNRSLSVGSNSGDEISPNWGNDKDKEIAERLRRLRRQRNKELLPTDLEIEERVARLKGMDPTKYKAPPVMVYRPDRRSSTERASDLIKQMKDEVQLDSAVAKQDEVIAARLSALRGEAASSAPIEDPVAGTLEDVQNPQEQMDIDKERKLLEEQYEASLKMATEDLSSLRKNQEFKNVLQTMKSEGKKENSEELEEEEEEEEADLIVERLLAATKLESCAGLDSLNGDQAQTPGSESGKMESFEEDEEFPWCVLCTEDAKIRCFGCDGDLYCMKCFRDCHDSLDIKDHKTCPFLFPRNSKTG